MTRLGFLIVLASLRLAGPPALSAQPTPCVGDCDRDGRVMIHELIVAVGIALEAQNLAECPAADAGADGSVQISDLVAAVGAALADCAAPPTMRSATATRTEGATVPPSPTATATPPFGIIDLGCASVGCTVVANTLDRSVSFVALGESTGARGAPSPGGGDALLGTVSLVGIPRSVAVAGDGLALVTTRSPDRLVIVDVFTQSIAGEIEGLGALPEAVAATPDAGLALVTNFDAGSVSIIDMPALAGLLRSQPRSSRTIAAAALVAQGTVQDREVGDNPNAIGDHARRPAGIRDQLRIAYGIGDRSRPAQRPHDRRGRQQSEQRCHQSRRRIRLRRQLRQRRPSRSSAPRTTRRSSRSSSSSIRARRGRRD